jgi:PKD repeat protein
VATGLTYTTANLSASTTFYFGPCPGHYRIPVRVVVDAVNAYITSPSPTPCAGSPGDFIGNGAAVNGTIGSWTWNFGDGSPAESGQNVTHSFDTAGTYLVVLTATTAFGCQAVAPFTVNILAGPTVSFSALDTAGCAPFTAAFTATATSTGSYTWDFGDGATDTTLTPSHTYLSPGLYTVSFSSATAQCVSRVDLPGYITVNPVPDASVVASTLAGCYPLAVTFNHQQYPSATYRWDFGDGDTSSSALPSHTFVTAGSFAVELITALNGCADTGTVTLTATAPLSVSISTTTVCQGAPSVFNISTSAPFVSAVWDFGDGTSVSVTGGVSHVYQLPGNYNASLVVTDVSGCQGTASQNVLVLPIPFVSFTVQPTSGCDTVAAQFNNQSTGASLYQWSFGDGTSSVQPTPFHLYTAPGNYAVTLVATAANGCSDTLSVPAMVTVYPSPSPSFTASATTICNDTCISFSDGSTGFPITWQWSFPGGSPSSSTSSAPGSICYSQPGTYAVTLITSGAYCSRSVTLNDYIHVSDCSVAPTAAFYCNDSVFCVNGCTSFQSTAQNATQWNWQFTGGTPASSTLPNPQFVCYPASGTYPVTLVVTNPAGSDTLYAAGMVTVDNVPPVPVFTRSGDTLITAVVPGYSYQWYVGGVPIPGANSYRYLALQSANYSVGVTNVSGCRALSQAQYVSLVGIDEAERSLGLEIYPNPFDERLVITTSVSGLTQLQLQFIDVTGRTIVTEHIDELKTGRQVSLSTSDISAGTYLVKITCNGRSFVRKLMKF